MKKLFLFSLLSLIPCFTFAQIGSETEQKKFVLLIGNNDYEHIAKLQNPVNDIKTLAKPFEGFGFTAIKKTDLNSEDFLKAIDSFKQMLIENPNSIAIIYYAGHAVQVDGKNYLLPINAKITNKFDLEYSAILIDRLLAALEEAKSGVKVLILDACRDNPFQRGLQLSKSGLAEIENASQGTYIAYSTKPGGVALDQDINGLSIFAKELAFHLSGSTNLSIEELFKKTRRSVIERTDGFQVPWESSSLTGKFTFNPSRKFKTPIRAFFSLYMPKLYCISNAEQNRLSSLTQIDPTSGYLRRSMNSDINNPIWSDWKPDLYRGDSVYYWRYFDDQKLIEERNYYNRDSFDWNVWLADRNQLKTYEGYCESLPGFIEDEIDKNTVKNCNPDRYPKLCKKLSEHGLDKDYFNIVKISELTFFERRSIINAFTNAAKEKYFIFFEESSEFDTFDLHLASGLIGKTTWWVELNKLGQTILRDLGYDLVIDGDVGPQTCAAVSDALGWEPNLYACGGNVISKSTILKLVNLDKDRNLM
jgi:hypothetical protein